MSFCVSTQINGQNFYSKSSDSKRSLFHMFANGKSPINVAKGWKGKAISEQKKVETLKNIIEDLKKLPPKNRFDEDIYEIISKEKLDSSNEAPQPPELNGPESIRQIIYDNWVSNEDKKPNT